MGYDLTVNGNCSAASKFDMIKDLALPATGQILHSFVGLVIFYHRYAPYLEICIKPLRQLLKTYFRKKIPAIAWTPEIVDLFRDAKVCITSSPILAWYNPGKLTFLKIEWITKGMGYILM